MLPKSFVIPLLTLGSASLAVAADPIPITGVVVRNGSIPIRRDINELASEAGPQWDLYVQSLTAMYETASSDALSFFQIAGIHLWPYVEWNGTGKAVAESNIGYCPHGEALFLPWHRPYVALYEQTLVMHAKEIAAKYPKDRRNDYLQAAEQLRSPYWDWAATRAVPEVTVPESVTINTPQGQSQVKNPLASYPYPKEALDGKYGDMSKIRPEAPDRLETYRCASPQSYPQSADAYLGMRVQSQRTQDLRSMTYDVFARSQTFLDFGTTGSPGTSIEQVHNYIHVESACGADMLNQAVSGFDPLFFLHHTNMDRLWAYWQAIHPEEATLSSSYAGKPRYRSAENTTITPDSPLDPFHDKSGKPYTPKTVVSTTDFGYTYEGLDGNKSEDQKRDEAIRLINTLYSGAEGTAPPPPGRPNNDGRPGINGTRPGTPPSGIPGTPRPVSPPPGNPKGKPPSSDDFPANPEGSPGAEGTRHSCQIQLDVAQVERPCFVGVYIGGVHAGTVTVMSHPATGIANYAIFVDSAIQQWKQNGTKGDFNDSINVDITKADGNRIPLNSVSSLNINVDKVSFGPRTSDNELPKVEATPLPPVNGGRQLTPPPEFSGNKPGPKFEGTVGTVPAGENIGGGRAKDDGKKAGKGPSSTAARLGPMAPFFSIMSALLAISSFYVLH